MSRCACDFGDLQLYNGQIFVAVVTDIMERADVLEDE